MEPRSSSSALAAAALLLASSLLLAARADDPYRFYTWNVTFGDIYPLGVKQEVRALPPCALCCCVAALLDALFPREEASDYSPAFANGRQLNVTAVMQGILINGQFPGPQIDAVTNDNIIVNVFNNLPVPFLLSW